DGDVGRFGTVVRLGAGQNLNRAAMQMKTAERRFVVFFGIAGVTQLRGELGDGRLHSDPHHLRSGENLCRSGERRTAEALLDDAIVLYIPVGKKSDHQERRREKTEQG